MKVVINAISAKMGGAVAYIRNFLPVLASLDDSNEYIVFLQSFIAGDFAGLAPNIRMEARPAAERSQLRRFLFDQWTLRRFARREGADCIFSTANFAILAPSAPQVVSVRNPVYFCRKYYDHVRGIEGRCAAFKVAMRRRMVALSAASSDIVVTPTAAMREMLLDWKAARPEKCRVIHHGFDRETFLSMRPTPSDDLRGKLARRGDETILFYPSLYGKHKNFDTLMTGLGVLARRGHNVRLILTCRIDPETSPYQRRTARIMEAEGVRDRVEMLGPHPYAYMPQIYEAADVVVWPTFAESFGHPLLEAMATAKPIVASALDVKREMAGDAALYFDTFDPRDFADKVEEALRPETVRVLTANGAVRAGDFSWRQHVASFIDLFKELTGRTDG